MKLNLRTKKVGAILLGLAMCFSLVAIATEKASANENGIGATIKARVGAWIGSPIKPVDTGSQMSISANGKVLVRGAKVTAISGNTLSAETVWGSYVSKWTIDASSAKFLRHSGGNSIIAHTEVGHTISFSGDLDTGSANAVVKADIVKNWSIDRGDVPRTGTLQGKLKAMADVNAPTTMTLEVRGKGNANDDAATGNFTVNVAANTAILDKNWMSLGLSEFETGDSVRFYGLINSDNTANATVVRNITR